MQLSEYSLECLRSDGEFHLYRGHATDPRVPSVLLLAPASTHPSPDTLKKIDHEYALRHELDSAWAVRPLAVTERSEQVTLVLEDPGGATLDEFLAAPMEITQFLSVAVGFTAALVELHKREWIHKDLKPSNVLVDSATGQVRLMGFGIASHLRREHQSPDPPELIAGTLPYMAPEQTGRMNRSIDSRSDLYALGVTLYEMLTGTRPFTASEPLEWIHCHIARIPVPPHERLTSVPAALSAIVMKLLAKTPEERYQTASGLERDLRRCLAEWEAHGRIVDFPPGEDDARDRLVMPEKLYGRAREIETLLAAFDRVVTGGRPELVLVSGYSGIGKSAVVNELHKRLLAPRGFFASGKFDQYKRDIPYATLARAFQSLIRPLLSKNEEDLGPWRDALHDALDPNGQLMVNLVPELKAIIGEQPPVPDLPPQDTQRRFHVVFRRFLAVFARPEHPLALFLDDLQWLDAATLDLMEDLLTQPDVAHLLLIGAYRDNEVDATHPLMRKLDAIRQAGGLRQDIVLAPLRREDLEQLIADSVRCMPVHASPLAQLVHDKTTGNPFFALQFISALFEEGLLAFDHATGSWSWDLTRIHAKGYTDNVAELMVRKLARLSRETQNALTQLACLGNSADFTTLGVVYEDAPDRIHAQLAEAVAAGFVLRARDSYRFLHDRVQEAAYALIPVSDRAQAHLRIGRLLAAHTLQSARGDDIFEILNHLNRGATEISSHGELERLAEFNLIAGKRAKASTAYVSALHYLVAGAALLPDDAWDCRPDLTFDLEFHRAECEFLTGELAAAEGRLARLASRATDLLDQASVACLRIDLYTTLNRSDLAVDVCLNYLRQLGVEWPPHPTDEEARREYERACKVLGDRQIGDLIDSPLMTNPESVATMDVLLRATSPAVYTDINLLSLVLWRMITLSLEHGNIDASCYAYVHGGALAGARFGNYKAGFSFGQLGYDLVDRRGLGRFEALTYVGFAVLIMSWTRHWRISRDLLRQAFDAANAIGHITCAAYAWHNLIGNLVAAGDPLLDVQHEAERGLEFVRKIGYGLVTDNIATQLALIRTLRGSSAMFGCLTWDEFDEPEIERRLSSDPESAFAACWYWIRKLQARFFAGDYSAAVDASLNAQRLLWTSECFVESAEAAFYGALSHAACCDAAGLDQCRHHVEALTGHHKLLVQWAENCPENFENRAAAVGAEMARLEGRLLDAEQLYEKAIRSARDNGFVHNEAIAYELAARFYAARGFDKFADAYLREARYCYQRWGADGKVAQLDHLYPGLEKEPLAALTSPILARTNLLDLATVMKVSQALSGGLVLEPLIDSLMRAAIEHAGAERGLLIRPQGDQLLIEAEAATGGDVITVHQRDDSANAAALPESVVRYVMRTRQDVILDDATTDNPFSADPYIRDRRARSILCLPLINQSNLAGVLYLENNLTARVFTPDRITILQLLASRAAISLENSRLYRDLEDRERSRSRLIAVRADVNLALTTGNTLRAILQSCAEAVVKHLDAACARIWVTTNDQQFLELHASAGTFTDRDGSDRLVPVGQSGIGRIAQEKRPHVTNEVIDDPPLSDRDWAGVEGVVAFAGFPLLAGGQVVGVLAMFLREPVVAVSIAAWQMISDTIAQSIQRKQAEEAVRRSEAFLAEAQALSQTGSWGWNTATGDLFWSRETYRIFGINSDVVPTLPMIVDVVHPDDRARFLQEVEMYARDRTDFEHEYRLKLRDGSIRYVYAVGRSAVRGFPDLDFIGAIMDVTERKQAADALLKTQADLAEVSRLTTMGELAASIAHEINQPLATVVTNAQTCASLLRARAPAWAEVESAVADIAEAGRRASDVIARIRLLLRKGVPEPVELNVNGVIQGVIALTRETTQAKGVLLEARLADDSPRIVGDRVQLQQVLINLVTNAVDAMSDIYDRPRQLTITSSGTDGTLVEVAVSDVGSGIDPAHRARIFEPFFTTKPEGMGMGLAICRGIIEAFGGRLWATSNPDFGTTVRFALPAAAAEGV